MKKNDEQYYVGENMADKDIIEGLPNKSLEEIIKEVADEENLTPEEVAQIVKDFQLGVKVSKKATKPKKDKVKDKKKKKIAKKSRKQNR